MLGKLLVEGDAADLPWFDINTLNLVAEVSVEVTHHQPHHPHLHLLLHL